MFVPFGTSREFPRVWQNLHPFNFDSVGWALLTLFEICSGEMWPDIMYDTVNANGLDQPMLEYDAEWPANAHSGMLNSCLFLFVLIVCVLFFQILIHSFFLFYYYRYLSRFILYNNFRFTVFYYIHVGAAIYYIAVTLVCGFLMLNVFVGVVIDEYNAIKGEEDGSGLMTDSQKQWVDSMKNLSSLNPMRVMTPPAQKWRMSFYNLVISKGFELFIMAAIMMNTIILAMTITPDDGRAAILESINFWIFAMLFCAEAVLKLIGVGPVQYFSVAWNKFDFTLVCFSFVGVVFDLGQTGSLLRIIRVARIFRLVKTSEKVLTLFKTLIFSMPSLVNVGIILLLLYFIFAIIGMNLFNGIKHGNFLNDDANFDTFGKSFNTLFRCSTGESYNAIMYDTMIQPPYCDDESGNWYVYNLLNFFFLPLSFYSYNRYSTFFFHFHFQHTLSAHLLTLIFIDVFQQNKQNSGSLDFPPIYFTMFFVLQNYIFLNLIVAIILDVFADTNAMAQNIISDRHLDSFQDEWSKFDLNANKWIDAGHLKELILKTEYPLGLKNVELCENDDLPEHLQNKSIDEIELRAQQICDEIDVYAHKHDSSYADSAESIRSDGYVYEISFQETLQELAVRVGKLTNKLLPDEIEKELSEKLQKKRDAQASAKRKKSAMGLPILVRDLERMFGDGTRTKKAKAVTISAQYVHHAGGEASDDEEDVRERGIV